MVNDKEYKVDPLRNKEVTFKDSSFKEILSSRGNEYQNIGARVRNLVT
jgi:hypothetical protein